MNVDDIGDASALAEHKAALAKIDAAVAHASALAGDALTCHRGCSSCCVDGLTVLPVEAALIREHLSPSSSSPSSPFARARVSRGGACAFLDVDGACSIYGARPVLCRTHGLALRAPRESARGLRILVDDVSACSLNYTARDPQGAEILDAERVLMLVTTVDRRYRARVGLSDDDARVPLSTLAAGDGALARR